MILIDKPYVSDFLIRTIREYNFQIISTPTAKEMIKDLYLEYPSSIPINYSKISKTLASTGVLYQVTFSLPLDVAHNWNSG